MDNKKIFKFMSVLCLFVLLAVTVMSGCSKSDTTSESKELVFGAVAPLSGPISMVGLQFVRSFEIFFDDLNEKGGITVDGQKYTFKFSSADSKYSAEGAAIAAKKLIYDDGAKYLFGGIGEFETNGVYSISKEAGALLLCVSNFPGSPADISPKRPLLVRPQYSVDDANSVVLDYLKKAYPKVKTVGLSLCDFGPELVDPVSANFKHAAEQRGFKVVEERWDVNTIDFIPIMTKLLAKKPDAICAYQSAQGADQYRAARQLGFKGPVFDTCPLGAEFYLFVEPKMTDFFCTGPNPEDMHPAMQEVQKKWNAKFKDPFMSDATQVWDMVSVFVQGILEADSVEPEKILSALETMTKTGDIKTTYGPASMGGKERFGVNRKLTRTIPLTHIMNGKMKLIGYFSGTYR